MNYLIPYTRKDLLSYTSTRVGEVKVGETISVLEPKQTLKESTAKYVIFGVPEDIGVRANFGRQGTENAWEAFLTSFCNIQATTRIAIHEALILGVVE